MSSEGCRPVFPGMHHQDATYLLVMQLDRLYTFATHTELADAASARSIQDDRMTTRHSVPTL
jgi:hypothetical protein